MRKILLATVFFLIPACASYTPLSKNELAAHGTHAYPKISRERLTEVSATALATLGYRVTLKQPRKGIVKTAPTTIMTSATGGENYANVSEDKLAWTLRIEPSGRGAVVHATPRGFRNGSEMTKEGMWVAEVMDKKFQDLWHEIDATLASE